MTMLDPGAYFLQQMKIEGEKKQRLNQFVVVASTCSLLILIVLVRFTDCTLTQLIICSIVLLTTILFVSYKAKKSADERMDSLLAILEVDPEVFGNSRIDMLMNAALSGAFETVQVSKTQQRNRGSDEKGFTSGKTESLLSDSLPRRDSALSESVYDGLEDDLRPSELLVNEANLRYETMAEKRWHDAESKDADLIEAGVERLGDLVRTDWFEKNAKPDAVQALMDSVRDEDEL